MCEKEWMADGTSRMCADAEVRELRGRRLTGAGSGWFRPATGKHAWDGGNEPPKPQGSALIVREQ